MTVVYLGAEVIVNRAQAKTLWVGAILLSIVSVAIGIYEAFNGWGDPTVLCIVLILVIPIVLIIGVAYIARGATE